MNTWIVLYSALIISALTFLVLSASFAIDLCRWKREDKRNEKNK